MLHMWKSRPLRQRLLPGKWTRDTSYGLGAPLKTESFLCNHDAHSLYYSHDVNSLVVATTRTQRSIITGVVENKLVEIMIDSGSSISLFRGNLITNHKLNTAPQWLQLVSAAGELISL